MCSYRSKKSGSIECLFTMPKIDFLSPTVNTFSLCIQFGFIYFTSVITSKFHLSACNILCTVLTFIMINNVFALLTANTHLVARSWLIGTWNEIWAAVVKENWPPYYHTLLESDNHTYAWVIFSNFCQIAPPLWLSKLIDKNNLFMQQSNHEPRISCFHKKVMTQVNEDPLCPSQLAQQ